MATHSSILVWRIPCTEEPGGLQSMGSQRATKTFDSLVAVLGLLTGGFRAWAQGHRGFISCSSWALEHKSNSAAYSFCSAAPCHVESSQIRDRTRVCCTGRRILYQCAIREAPPSLSRLRDFAQECRISASLT